MGTKMQEITEAENERRKETPDDFIHHTGMVSRQCISQTNTGLPQNQIQASRWYVGNKSLETSDLWAKNVYKSKTISPQHIETHSDS